MRHLVIAGAGMAGLSAAARARELGASPVVLEKGTRPGGSMLLSSGVIWRYRSFEEFRTQCPSGDERVQRLVFERLDEGLEWLELLGAPVVTRETENPLTTGVRFDPAGLTEALFRAAGEVRLGQWGRGTGDPLVLASGGFQADPELVERYVGPAAPLRVRANPWSAGDGLRIGLERGAALSAGLDEFYGRNMADVDFDEAGFVPLAQVYGRHARIFNERGEEFFDHEQVGWSELDLVQATAHQPGARAWYLLDERALDQRVRYGPVRDLVASAPTRTDPGKLPFEPPPGTVVAVRVAAAITHTIGGLRVDDRARVLDEQDKPIDGLFAAGADAGGISTGGYASGLASALVLGRAAAETAFS
ncbi:MAG TPA: FAD-dependent oxidoreductase [Gaiellaceae bacterium]|jgi:succinate dehydrogenase/fumarate reductase flavoprotein subunit|nr:FAD-dependent oxidoreductase [Gaiellaceae bacterium]